MEIVNGLSSARGSRGLPSGLICSEMVLFIAPVGEEGEEGSSRGTGRVPWTPGHKLCAGLHTTSQRLLQGTSYPPDDDTTPPSLASLYSDPRHTFSLFEYGQMGHYQKDVLHLVIAVDVTTGQAVYIPLRPCNFIVTATITFRPIHF